MFVDVFSGAKIAVICDKRKQFVTIVLCIGEIVVPLQGFCAGSIVLDCRGFRRLINNYLMGFTINNPYPTFIITTA